MELRKYKLGDIGEVRMCKRILKEETNTISGIPFYKIGTFGNKADVFISLEKFKEYKEKFSYPKKGDILISAAGTIGRTVIYDGSDSYFQDSNIVWIDNDETKVLNKYLFYCYKNIHWFTSKGSTILRLYNDNIRNTEIVVPPLESQKKIAAVLSTLDDNIALNRRMNAKLEQMAKRLYDHWFVQFDFPNADGKPYKSSGGKMVWNEELKREIPEGWEVKSLGEVCDFPIERFSDKDISEKLYVPIEVIPRYEMSFSETANIEKAASGLCSFTKRSILLSNRRVYFHKVCIAPFEGITRDTVIIINSKDLNNLGFIYQIVNSNHFIDYATLNSYGSEQPVLSTPTVQDYKFVFPNNGIDKIYSKRVDSIINKVLENNLEIRKLTALRNRVLPLLMNGQVEVN